MFKSALKVLALFAPAFAFAQGADNSTIAANSTAPAGGETLQQAEPEVNWASLEALVGGLQCSQNMTLEALLANSSNPYLLPQSYMPAFLALNLDWNSIQDVNATRDFLAWNATQFMDVLEFYVGYHDAIAN
jgi:hypothetical protein